MDRGSDSGGAITRSNGSCPRDGHVGSKFYNIVTEEHDLEGERKTCVQNDDYNNE